MSKANLQHVISVRFTLRTIIFEIINIHSHCKKQLNNFRIVSIVSVQGIIVKIISHIFIRINKKKQ